LPKKTLDIIKSTGNDALIQVKGNQPTLLNTLTSWAEAAYPGETHTTHDIGRRNRNEMRRATVWPLAASVIEQLPGWPGIACLVRIERATDTFSTLDKIWKKRDETAWYICTRMLTASEANACARQHWSIENSYHHVRDVTLQEDASRIRKNPGTFACLRSWALNLLHIKGHHNIRAARESLGWDANAAWNCVMFPKRK
jgi:predicted transposase YbfD/YdcC